LAQLGPAATGAVVFPRQPGTELRARHARGDAVASSQPLPCSFSPLRVSRRSPAHFPLHPRPLFVLPTKKPRSHRNPSRRGRAPTWRLSSSSLAAVSSRSSTVDSVVPPSQSKLNAIDDDASFTFLPPATEEENSNSSAVKPSSTSPSAQL
jgi:hypothetical protein